MLMTTLPEESSSRSCRHRPLATIVPASPPPTMRIPFAILLPPMVLLCCSSMKKQFQRRLSLFRFAHDNAPVAILLRDADHLVVNLFDPFRNIFGRALVARQHFYFIADIDELQACDQLHERTGTVGAAGIYFRSLTHRPHASPCSYIVINCPFSASDRNLVSPSAPSNRPSTKWSISHPLTSSAIEQTHILRSPSSLPCWNSLRASGAFFSLSNLEKAPP